MIAAGQCALQAEIAAHSSTGSDSGEDTERSRGLDKRLTVDCWFLVRLCAFAVVCIVPLLHCFSSLYQQEGKTASKGHHKISLKCTFIIHRRRLFSCRITTIEPFYFMTSPNSSENKLNMYTQFSPGLNLDYLFDYIL